MSLSHGLSDPARRVWRRRGHLAIGAISVVVAAGVTPAAADASPVWNLDVHHLPTHFEPGGIGSATVETVRDGASPATDEIQRVTINADAGQFRLSFGAETTSNIGATVDPDVVRAALEGLPSIAPGDVVVTGEGAGGTSDPYVITFAGAYAATNVAELVTSQGTSALSHLGEYWFEVANSSPDPATGLVSIQINLPSGITRHSIASEDSPIWTCPGGVGASSFTCTTTGGVPAHGVARSLVVRVSVAPGASGVRFATATVSGGGAASPASASELTQISAAPAGFGIVENSWRADFFEANGSTPVRLAGSHPEQAIFSFDLNSILDPCCADLYRKNAAENIRDLQVDLPAGFLGNPTVLAECKPAELITESCPVASQVGRFDGLLYPINSDHHTAYTSGIYNMEHPKGSIADLGFTVTGAPVHIRASLDPDRNYAIRTQVLNITETLPVYASKATIWGVPADPSHDSERCPSFNPGGDTSSSCPAGKPRKPFLTIPSQCDEPVKMTFSHYDSWDNIGVFGPDVDYELPGLFTDCAASQDEFEPNVSIVPSSVRADSPTGLNVTASVPFNDSPDEVSNPPVKRLEVKLPEGMAVNPAFADGLRGCTEAEIGITHAGVPDMDPVSCPDASRIGAVELDTPLLPIPADFPPNCPGTGKLQGSIYLAKQTENPVNELFAIYTIIHDCEDRGVRVKLPGSMILDPETGQITTVFDNLPQFPFDALSVQFRSGDRAPLINPPTCGVHTIEGNLNTYAMPGEEVPVDSSYSVTQNPDGSPCSTPTRASRPHNPTFSAGAANPTAGTFSPFVVKLRRNDGSQEFTSLSAELPPGLTGKLAGVDICPTAVLDAIPTAPGTGQAEKDNPSCPANSRIGRANAGSGAGSQPFYIPGAVYLAGPYKGAPVSVAVVTPAVTGGLDLGNVVVRSALHLDSKTAQASVRSDPIPTILHGVPIHLRDLRVVIDRDQFTLNPTNCNPMAVTGQAGGAGASLVNPADDTSAALSDRFQVNGCQNLDFRPKLILKLKGGTRRGAYPALRAILLPRPGDANIASVSVAFPRSEFLANEHIRTLCTRADFAASACPAGAIYGTATATSPLFDYALRANVYLRASENLLPDVVPDFRGPDYQPIRFESAGRVDSVNQGIRNTFDFIPDAPVTKVLFALQGGKKGLLVNSRDICKRAYRAKARFTAHNGDSITRRVKLRANCRKSRKGKRRKGKRAGHRRGSKRHRAGLRPLRAIR